MEADWKRRRPRHTQQRNWLGPGGPDGGKDEQRNIDKGLGLLQSAEWDERAPRMAEEMLEAADRMEREEGAGGSNSGREASSLGLRSHPCCCAHLLLRFNCLVPALSPTPLVCLLLREDPPLTLGRVVHGSTRRWRWLPCSSPWCLRRRPLVWRPAESRGTGSGTFNNPDFWPQEIGCSRSPFALIVADSHRVPTSSRRPVFPPTTAALLAVKSPHLESSASIVHAPPRVQPCRPVANSHEQAPGANSNWAWGLARLCWIGEPRQKVDVAGHSQEKGVVAKQQGCY